MQPGFRTAIALSILNAVLADNYIMNIFNSKSDLADYFDTAIEKLYNHMLEEVVIFDTRMIYNKKI